jgi:hypothetical protein
MLNLILILLISKLLKINIKISDFDHSFLNLIVSSRILNLIDYYVEK